MNKTSIEWCRTYQPDGSFVEGHTVNPVRFIPHGSGQAVTMCQKVSPGCKNCYAESITRRFYPKNADYPFEGYTALGVVQGNFFLDEAKLQGVLKHRKPTKIFWGDMTDLFGEWVKDEWLDRIFAVCALTPHITHIFLTKRPERMLAWFNRGAGGDCEVKVGQAALPLADSTKHIDWDWSWRKYETANGKPRWPLPNVWLGVSVENQEQADKRIPLLLQTPASVRFVSAEPLVADLKLTRLPIGDESEINALTGETAFTVQSMAVRPQPGPKLGWVIVGGESGTGLGIRMMQANWAQSLRDQCVQTGTPYFFKQWGAFLPDRQNPGMTQDPLPPSFGGIRLGKGAAGDLLDGKQWHQFPSEVRA